MENEETEFQDIDTNNTNTTNNSENTSNNENEVNDTIQNITVEVVQDEYTKEQLNLIHNDLGFICSFTIFFVLVVLLKYSYKFFDMFFQI